MRINFLRVRWCVLYLRFQPNFRDTHYPWLSIVDVDVLHCYVDVACAVDRGILRAIFIKRTRYGSLWLVFQQREESGRKAKKRFGHFEDGYISGCEWN